MRGVCACRSPSVCIDLAVRKPSLAALMAEQAAGKAKPRPQRRRSKIPTKDAPEPPAELARAVMIRQFVASYLRHNLNASAALREVRPEVSSRSVRVRSHELLQQDDVRAELYRQLGGIIETLELDEDWVRRQWKSMAESDICDYIEVNKDTKAVRFVVDPEVLTKEQRLNIRRIKVDSLTSKIVELTLANREHAVELVAKAKKMFIELEQAGLQDMAQEIVERMQRASKQMPRIFDNSGSGEEAE